MDTCILANTGVNVYYAAGIAVAMLSIPLLIIFRATRHRFGILFLVLIFSFAAVPTPALAGPSCSPTAGNAVTSGVQGATQVYSIVGNDTPTSGATFVASSLRLGLRSGSPAGSSLSADRLTAVFPSEGSYSASTANVTIAFTPEMSFLGTGTGVTYSIDDTAGNTLTNTYTPTVTSGATACQDPTISTTALHARKIFFEGGVSDGNIVATPLAGIGTTFFTSVSSSADGTKLAAIAQNDSIYTSTNSGATWNEQSNAGKRYWTSITSSADGTKLAVAAGWGDSIYTSTDSGVTWTERISAGSYSWNSIASSADGTKLVATQESGYIYTSTDSGATWNEQTDAGSRQWSSVASSADGTSIAATVNYGGYIYTSTDSGATWNEQTDAGSRFWTSITSSADGTKLVATVWNGYIYTSTDSGATWNEQTDAGSRLWPSVTSSADGVKLAAAAYGGYIYTSTDSGATWNEQTDAGSRNWYYIASSADGTKLAAVAYGSYSIYTSADSGITWMTRHETAIDPDTIDIDPATPGLQTAIDKTLTEGWSALYNPITDRLVVTVTNSELVYDHLAVTDDTLSYYTLYLENCIQPSVAPIMVKINVY